MATKAQLTKMTVRGSQSLNLYFEGKPTPIRDTVAIDGVDFPVMPDLLNVVEDYFTPADINYKDAVTMAEEISLLTRAYYMQFVSFFHKNEREANTRIALRGLHERFCKVPHPYIDPNIKKLLKLKEDNYERIIIKESPRKRKKRTGRSA